MDESSSLSILTLALAKKYTDSQIGEAIEFKVEIVQTLPQNPDRHTIYLVPKSSTDPTDGYIEQLQVNKQEIIGQTSVNLDDYYTKTEVDQLFIDHQYVLPQATENTLGGVKLSSQFDTDIDGKVVLDENAFAELVEDSVAPIDNADISDLFNH